MIRASCTALFLLGTACTDRRPTRLAMPDTVVVNSTSPTRLPVTAYSAGGRMEAPSGVRFTLVSGEGMQLSDSGTVSCPRRTDAEVRVTLGEVSARAIVLCRPIRGFRLPPRVLMLTTDSARELDVGAIGVDGSQVTALAGSATVRDSQYVVIRHGQLVPKAPGTTFVDVTVGDCAISVPVDVIERESTPDRLSPNEEFAAALRLVAGEIRSWHIPPGRYDLELVTAPRLGQHLVLGGTDLNCSNFPGQRERQHYSCVARTGAVVVIRHPQPAGSGAAISGELHIRRLEDAATAVAGAARGGDRRRTDACTTIIQ